MEKNPAECKHSMLFGDIYICKIQTIPCAALNRCALAVVDDIVDAMNALIELQTEQEEA